MTRGWPVTQPRRARPKAPTRGHRPSVHGPHADAPKAASTTTNARPQRSRPPSAPEETVTAAPTAARRAIDLTNETTETTPLGPFTTWELWARIGAGRPERIGWLIHRAYDSGYPDRFEVAKNGGRPWGFYPERLAAIAGARDYAAAVRARRAQHPEVIDYDDVAGPADDYYARPTEMPRTRRQRTTPEGH